MCLGHLRDGCLCVLHIITQALPPATSLFTRGPLIEWLADFDRPICKLGFDSWSPALSVDATYELPDSQLRKWSTSTMSTKIKVPRHRYRAKPVDR